MEIAAAAVLSFLLDLLIGDPRWIPHPVVLMGKLISLSERFLRRLFPKTQKGELAAGTVMAIALPIFVLCFCLLVLWLLGLIHPALRFALEVFWGCQALAMRDLRKESMFVLEKLQGGTLEEAREAVGRIVGRDTAVLTAEGVTKAAVETVAENFSDGEAAPLLYLLIGGAPLAMCYKAINTMDSMVGYKNERFLYYGRAAAKLDDAANWIPARLAALLLIAAAAIGKGDGKNALRIWKRDRRNHASPNSAQTESVMAGALRIRLAGPAYYFGEYYDKPFIGDPLRPVEADDIRKANNLMYIGGFLALACFTALRVLVCLFL